jgi:3,4-dihydroxy-9,10-secoandrosta-1,3,5(10)-triene-9,17-dione 4,5-dioxygenase
VIRNLASIGFTSPAADEWRTFGPEVLGAQLAPDGPGGAVRLRVDDAPWRIEIRPGEVDDIAYLGWEVDDLAATAAAVEASGTAVHDGAFVDPFGFHHRLATAPGPGEPFIPGRPLSGFVTGDQGLGHAVLVVPDLAAAERFYGGVLGLRTSDTIDMGFTVLFLHCVGAAARHHSLALAAVPGMVGVHHLMLEVGALDDVGTALDVVNEREIPLAMGLGRHTNDLMTSFYVRTPSGFEVEYGTGGRTVDDETWQVGAYDAGSIWGHRRPATGPLLPAILHPYEPQAPPAQPGGGP